MNSFYAHFQIVFVSKEYCMLACIYKFLSRFSVATLGQRYCQRFSECPRKVLMHSSRHFVMPFRYVAFCVSFNLIIFSNFMPLAECQARLKKWRAISLGIPKSVYPFDNLRLAKFPISPGYFWSRHFTERNNYLTEIFLLLVPLLPYFSHELYDLTSVSLIHSDVIFSKNS